MEVLFDEEKKPTHVSLKVKSQKDYEVWFRIRRDVQLNKLMYAYCTKQAEKFGSLMFIYNGSRIRGEHTPDELQMEDGDEIDVFKEHL